MNHISHSLIRLQTAVNRQVENEEAAWILVFQLAYENANADCKNALASVRGSAKTLVDYIKACQDVGSKEHKANVLAVALAQHFTMNKSNHRQSNVKCFNHNQEGHMQRGCPQKKGGWRTR